MFVSILLFFKRWSVSTILLGFQSFMLDSDSTLGSVDASAKQRRQLAVSSLDFNCRDKTFRELFPHHVTTHEQLCGAAATGVTPGGASTSSEDLLGRQQLEPTSAMLVLSVVISAVLLAVILRLFF